MHIYCAHSVWIEGPCVRLRFRFNLGLIMLIFYHVVILARRKDDLLKSSL